MLTWGLASLGAGSRPFFSAAGQLLLEEPSLAAYNSYTLSTLTWSFGRVRLPPSEQASGHIISTTPITCSSTADLSSGGDTCDASAASGHAAHAFCRSEWVRALW